MLGLIIVGKHVSVSVTVLWCVKCVFVDRRQPFGETTVIFKLENRDSRYRKNCGIYCLPKYRKSHTKSL